MHIAGQPAFPEFLPLGPSAQVGQSFTPRFDGLSEISFFIEPDGVESVEIQFDVYTNPPGDAPLASVSLNLNAISAAGHYPVSFAAIDESTGQDLVFLLTNIGAGTVRVGAAPGDAYLNGAAIADGIAVDKQLAFTTGYAPLSLAFGLLEEAFVWLLRLAQAFMLFVVPGWALLSLLDPSWSTRDWFEKAALSAGVSLAMFPLLMLWTSLVGLRLGALYAWLPIVFAVGLLAWKAIPAIKKAYRRPLRFHIRAIDLLTLSCLLLLVASRFWAIRNVDVPLFGDSYQHSMITQLILDHRGLFNSWQPYAEMETFTYHFGFHATSAVFAWVSRLAAPQSVLWFGQILNVLAVMAIYPLARKTGGSRLAGLVALVIAGLLSPMPGNYVNWGRYTQLTAQAILPIFALLYIDSTQAENTARARWALPGLVLAGLGLTHYRIVIFAVIFLAAYHITYFRKRHIRRDVYAFGFVLCLTAILTLPWLINAFAGRLVSMFSAQLATPTNVVRTYSAANNPGPLDAYLPLYAWWLLLASIVLSFLLRKKLAVAITLWWGLILLAANPQWFSLPGAGILTSFAVFIAAYIPAGILIGAALTWLVDGIKTHIPQVLLSTSQLTAAIALLLVAAWGAFQQARLLNPGQYALVTRPDLRAAAWIDTHLPSDARFVVNTFPAFYDTSIVGSDGGWWLPLLARRSSTLPPITYAFERDPHPGFRQSINDLSEILAVYGPVSDEYMRALEDRKVTHLYIGQRRGSVNYNEELSFNPDTLLSDARYQPVYHQDLVWIFEVHP